MAGHTPEGVGGARKQRHGSRELGRGLHGGECEVEAAWQRREKKGFFGVELFAVHS